MYHALRPCARGAAEQIGVSGRINLHRCNARRFLDTQPLGFSCGCINCLQRVRTALGSTSDGGLEGCQLELDTLDGGVETDTNYLWRFGVLLAEDAAAHKVLPQLPIASAGALAEWRAGS